MWFITARPAVGTAGILLMSVGLNSQMRHLDPLAVVIEYVLLGLIALVIGGVVGFVVIPAWRPKNLTTRVADAVERSASVLAALGEETARQSPESVLRLLGDAQAATQQLVPDREHLSPEQQNELEQLRTGLNDLTVTALFAVSDHSPGTTLMLRSASAALSGVLPPEPAFDQDTLAAAALLLASEVAERRDRVIASLGA